MINNKGILVKFLLTVLLALIIFTPACIFTSKLFRLSDQAGDSFGQFVTELKKFATEAKDGDHKNVVLTIDEESGIFFFQNKERQFFHEEIKIESNSEGSNDRKKVVRYFAFPDQSCKKLPCVCLCREFSGTPQTANVYLDGLMMVEEATVPCKQSQAVCEEIPRTTFGIANPIYRDVRESRRVSILFEKTNNAINIKKQ